MRILLIYNRYQYRGGEDTYVDSLLQLLKDKGNQVKTYIKDSRDINEKNFFEKLKIGLGMFWNLKVEKELSQLIRDFKPDIAHFHNIYPLIGPIAYRVCKKFNVPIVQTIHNYKFMCPKGTLFRNGKICELCVKKKFAYPSIFYGCYHQSRFASAVFSSSFLFHRLIKSFDLIDAFIFPAEFTKDYYVNKLNLSLSKTHVVPYFVDIDRKSTQKEKKGDYFLFAGRLSEEKGIIQLLDLFISLPMLRLVVIGDGPLRNEVLKYKKYKNIIIKDFLSQKEVYNYMCRALFTIIPSTWYEVLPLVLIESFVNNTAVIIPKFGSFISLVKNGKTGIFYQYNNYKDLYSRLAGINRNEVFINKMSMFVEKKYKSSYTSDTHYTSIIKVYENLLRQNSEN